MAKWNFFLKQPRPNIPPPAQKPPPPPAPPPKLPMNNPGWITGISSVCSISVSGSPMGFTPSFANQNFYYRYPTCAVCNRFVEKFEQTERPEIPARIFRATCHGSVEEHTIVIQFADSEAVFKLIAKPWFMADYEKLKVERSKSAPPLKPARDLLEKPVRRIDLEK